MNDYNEAKGFSGTSHTPISRAALDGCLVELLEEGVEIPAAFDASYTSWEHADGAGYWACDVAKVIEYARSAMHLTHSDGR